MRITSTAFQAGEPIPSIYTCDGENKNPELSIEEVPERTMSFALIVDDPDAPNGVFTHWLIWNIDGRAQNINEGLYAPEGVTEGVNGSGKRGYMGPCPPDGHGTHHYHFKLYALDSMLVLPPTASKEELMDQIEKHKLDEAELIGTYKKEGVA